jgi:threonine aldolase
LNPRFDFFSDNTAGAAPEAMASLIEANRGFASGYGTDTITQRAADLVRGLLDADAEVRFVASGTAANAISLAALAQPFEAVLAHEHAHILKDETGAPVHLGHGLGLIGLEGASGKIDPKALAQALTAPDSAHRQSPAALSITNATEYGTLYTEAEIKALTDQAKAKGLGVHLDGARLANAAASGLDLKALKHLNIGLLVFGGTKAGMPPTEALVVFNPKLARRLDARLKQAGQLPSKGRFYAAPWIGMIETGALVRHAAHANAMARRLAELMPFEVAHRVQANAMFARLPDAALSALLAQGIMVHRVEDGSVRFMCSWATELKAVDKLGAVLKALA